MPDDTVSAALERIENEGREARIKASQVRGAVRHDGHLAEVAVWRSHVQRLLEREAALRVAAKRLDEALIVVFSKADDEREEDEYITITVLR